MKATKAQPRTQLRTDKGTMERVEQLALPKNRLRMDNGYIERVERLVNRALALALVCDGVFKGRNVNIIGDAVSLMVFDGSSHLILETSGPKDRFAVHNYSGDLRLRRATEEIDKAYDRLQREWIKKTRRGSTQRVATQFSLLPVPLSSAVAGREIFYGGNSE